MLSLNVQIDTSGVDRTMRRYVQRIESATATALTRVMQSAQRQIRADTARVFDRPTRWALGASYVEPANRRARKFDAAVWLKNRNGLPGEQSSYLWPEVLGGGRERKAYETRLMRVGVLRSNEFTVPTEFAKLDAYGNVPPSYIRQVLSQLGAANARDNSGYDSNVKRGEQQSKQSKKRQLRAGTFFVSRGSSTGNPLPRGIYRRLRTPFGWVTRMVFAIVVGKPRYRPRLPFFSTIEQTRRRELQQHFDAEIARISQD